MLKQHIDVDYKNVLEEYGIASEYCNVPANAGWITFEFDKSDNGDIATNAYFESLVSGTTIQSRGKLAPIKIVFNGDAERFHDDKHYISSRTNHLLKDGVIECFRELWSNGDVVFLNCSIVIAGDGGVALENITLNLARNNRPIIRYWIPSMRLGNVRKSKVGKEWA